MQQINIRQALYHMRLLSGDADNKQYFQHFFDPKELQERPDLAKNIYGTFNNLKDDFESMQSQMCGIYVTVNMTDGKGRKEENIIGYRVVFADWDSMAEPVWPIQPHFKTSRDATHGHAYWKISDIENADQFRSLQLRIAMSCGTDQKVHDPCRVLRVAGTVHYKYPNNPAMYTVVEDYVQVVGDNHKYTMADIVQAFKLDETQSRIHSKTLIRMKGDKKGEGLKENPFYTEQCKNWLLTKANPAIEGDGSNEVYRVAGYLKDRGLPLALAKELMWENYNPRCLPVWEDEFQWQFEQYIANQYKHGKSVEGCKTAIGTFMGAADIVKPIGGWEANSKINDLPETTMEEATVLLGESQRIARESALNLNVTFDAKTPHYVLAQMFDGLKYDGNKIWRNKKESFVYNGRSYTEFDDDNIKAQIQTVLSKCNPPESLTKGVQNCFETLINIPEVRDGFKISKPREDCSNLVPFKNMIVNIDTKTTIPHSPDFFTFAELDYNYNVDAPVPKLWVKTINEIFDGCQDTIIALEEFLGYCMTYEVKYQKFAVFAGLSRTGKGLICHILTKLVGKKSMAAPQLPNLIQDAVLEKISSKKVALINEAHSVPIQRRDGVVSTLKTIVAADSLTFNRKYKGAKTMIPTCRVILSTNNVPEFIDASGALTNRMLVFPFRVSFKGREDYDLYEKLGAEIEGIAQRCIKAYEGVKAKGGFTESLKMTEERAEIEEDMNPLSNFYLRYCDFTDGARTSTKELHDYYQIFARLSHDKNPYTENKFSRHLKASGIGLKSCKVMIEGGLMSRGWEGIEIKQEVKDGLRGRDTNVSQFQNRSKL